MLVLSVVAAMVYGPWQLWVLASPTRAVVALPTAPVVLGAGSAATLFGAGATFGLSGLSLLTYSHYRESTAGQARVPDLNWADLSLPAPLPPVGGDFGKAVATAGAAYWVQQMGDLLGSDTGDAAPGEILEPGQYVDLNGDLRWQDTNQLVAHQPQRPTFIDDDGIERWADTRQPVDTTRPDPPLDSGASAETADLLWEHWGIDLNRVTGAHAELDQKVADAMNKPYRSDDGTGARGELAELRDALAEGRTVEIVANDPNQATPDLRVDGQPVEIKATETDIKPRWFERRIKDAGEQIAGFGEAGGIIHLRVADETLSQLDWGQVERYVNQALSGGKAETVDRVEIASISGTSRWSWERTPTGDWRQTT